MPFVQKVPKPSLAFQLLEIVLKSAGNCDLKRRIRLVLYILPVYFLPDVVQVGSRQKVQINSNKDVDAGLSRDPDIIAQRQFGVDDSADKYGERVGVHNRSIGLGSRALTDDNVVVGHITLAKSLLAV